MNNFEHKHIEERKVLVKAIIFFLLLSSGCAVLLIWAARSEDSAMAEKIRNTIGIKGPTPSVVEAPIAPPPPPPVVEPTPEPMPVPVVMPEPEPLPEIDYKEISRSKNLWPKTLNLKSSTKVSIRYQEQTYGFMEFTEGSSVKVLALKAPSEVYCSINGNHLSLSVHETDFVDWFTDKYKERYRLKPISTDETNEQTVEHALDTPDGEAAFWSEIRIWCHQNYEAISLSIEKDTLVFRWLPKEDAPINYQLEAREIARTYLLIRSRLGGTENYAACEIRDPTTDALLGSSSIFIPRL